MWHLFQWELSPVKRLLRQVFQDCEKIAVDAPGSTRRITALLQQLSLIYYLDVRKQALLSFWSALGAAVVGMLFFLYAILHAMSPGGRESAQIGLWAGALTQFIAAVNFLLYFRVARQFATFHVCLERTNRFLLANTMCESLDPPTKDEVRKVLVDIVACAPMLTLDGSAEARGAPTQAHTHPSAETDPAAA
jgi:hypothetical protein